MSSLNAVITAWVRGTYAGTNDLASVEADFNSRSKTEITLTPGTSSGNADLIFMDTRTLAASATENLDLAGGLVDPLGLVEGHAQLRLVRASARSEDVKQAEAQVEAAKADGRWDRAYKSGKDMKIPADLQAAIDADLRAGVLGAVEAQKARQRLNQEAELFGALDGVMRLIRGDVLLAVLLWLGLFVVATVQLSTGSGLPIGDAVTQAGTLTLTVGLCTQTPVLLVTMAAVLLLLRGTASPSDSSEKGSPLQLVIAADVTLTQEQAQTITDGILTQVGLATLHCTLQTDPQLRRQLRISLHGAILTQHTLADGEAAQTTLTYRLYDLVPELLTLDGLRLALSELGEQRPALVSEVVPKRVPLGRLLLLLRRLLAERVWPLPIGAVLEVLAQLPELDADPDALVEQVRAGLGRHLLSGHLLRNPAPESDNALAALVLSSDVEEVLRDARRTSGGLRLAIEPELRQEIIDSVLMAKARSPEAVLLCHGDVRVALQRLLAGSPEALPVLAYSELPPSLPVLVVGRVSPGA